MHNELINPSFWLFVVTTDVRFVHENMMVGLVKYFFVTGNFIHKATCLFAGKNFKVKQTERTGFGLHCLHCWDKGNTLLCNKAFNLGRTCCHFIKV